MRSVAVLLLAGLAALSLAGPKELAGYKVAKPPKIDGHVDQGEWDDVPSGSGFFDKNTGAVAEGGTYWLAYDSKYIYFAAKLDSANPKALKANEYRSNVSLKSDDTTYLVVDPFGSFSSQNVFGVNARGATDVRIAGGRAVKREWLGEIAAGGRITETGYEVEARIPWGIMRLPTAGLRDVRFAIDRYDAATQRDTLNAFFGNNAQDIPVWKQVDVPPSGNDRSIKLLPYLYAGFGEHGHVANGGLDFKTSLNDRLDVVGTINPDFRNIENQILSLDFSYFERLAGESRPFFLEGGKFFQTSQDAPMFASQRIQNFDAGFKTFGQLTDKTRFAFLDTVDFGNNNATVAHVRHQMDPNSGITAEVTNWTNRLGPDNLGTFLAFDTQRNGLGFFGSHSMTRDTDQGVGQRYNTGIFYDKNGWDGFAEYVSVSPQFNPRLGFAPERDFRGLDAGVNYVKPIKTGPIMEWGFGFFGRDFRTFENDQYRRGADLSTTLTFRDGTDLDLGANFERFRGSNDHLYTASLERPRGDNYRHWQIDVANGRLGGEPYRSLGGSISYRPISLLQLSLRLQDVTYFDRSTQVIFSANYDIGKDMSLSGRMVRQNNNTNFYLAFRKSGNKGAEYYVIYGDPNATRSQRSLILKAVFPFEVKI